MTVSTETASVTYNGNGVTTSWAVPYYILESSHIRVSLFTAAGSESVKVLNTDYTVSGAGTNPSTAQVTATTFTPATGEKIVIKRDVPVTQETDYVENDAFPAESHEKALDKLTMIVQQQEVDISKSLRLPITSSVPTLMPEPSANQYPKVKSDKSGFEWIDASVSVPAGEDIIKVTNVATMKALTGLADGALIQTIGYSVAGKGAGTYRYNATSSAAANEFTVVAPNDGGGRFELIEDRPNMFQAGALFDGVTDDTARIQAAIDARYNKSLWAPSGTSITGQLNISSPIVIIGEGYYNSTLKAASASGSIDLINITSSGVHIFDLGVDLDNTANTIAAGFVANRNGIKVTGTVGSYINNIKLRVRVKNCGEAAIRLQYVDRCEIISPDIDRIGQYGIYGLSVSNVWVSDPDIKDVFPGDGGVAPYLNAYGITFTYSGTDPKSTDCTVINGMVEDVTSWEAYDTHGGDRIRFINCSSKNCNQGVVIQSTASNYESNDIEIIGGTHDGYGSTTRDSTSFDTSGGVIANMGGAVTGKNLTISDVIVRDMGGKVTGTSAASYKIEACSNFTVANCHAVNAYQWAFRTNGVCLDGRFLGNGVKGLIEANSIKSAFSFSDKTFAVVDDNTVAGMPAGGRPWDISAPASSAYGIKFGAGNVVEDGGIDAFSDTSYQNLLAGSGFLGVAKAWVNFDGTGGASIRDQYGITSVVRNSDGNYTITFNQTVRTSECHCFAFGSRFVRKSIAGTTNNSITIVCENPIGTPTDDAHVTVLMFGVINRK